MKKTLLIIAVTTLVLGVFGVGVAFAQDGQPPFGGPMGMTSTMGGGGYGPMHDYVEQALATRLGLTEQQVEDQLAVGKPTYQIALDNGIRQEDLAHFMNEVHEEAFAKAIQDGVLTQEQADWMLQRMQNRFQNGYVPGNCPMHNGQSGRFGRGRGMGTGMMWGQGTQNP